MESNEPIKIYLPVSNLAVLVGLSKYGSLSQVLLSLWHKVDEEGYNMKLKELEQIYNKSLKSVSEWEKLDILSKELGLNDMKTKTYSIMKKTSKEELEDNQMAVLRDIDQSVIDINLVDTSQLKDIKLIREKIKKESDEKKKTLTKLFNSLTNRGFGNKHEKSAIDIYINLTNSTITEQQKVLIAKLKSNTYNIKNIKNKTGETNKTTKKVNVEWYLKGKIDALATTESGENILVEIKNRTRSLFGHLKDYEKPQIQTYLKLMGLKKGHLVEHLKTKTQNDINISMDINLDMNLESDENKIKIKELETILLKNTNIIEVPFEPEYWKMLKTRFIKFIDFFTYFMENSNLQEMLLIKSQYDEEYDTHLRNILETYF